MAATKPDNPGNFGYYKIKTPEELQQKVNAYFDECDRHQTRALVGTGPNAEVRTFPDPKPYTWTGLALAIGLAGRKSILNYCERDGYAPILRAARMKIEAQWEEKLQRLGNNNGVMFALTNNTIAENRYVNKTEQDVNLGGQAGNPVEVKHTADDLTEEQLLAIQAILRKG